MRWTMLFLNLLAAVAFVFLAALAAAAHRTRALSTYYDLKINHVFVEKPAYTNGQPLDVAAQIRSIGGGGSYSMLGYLGAGACLLNGFVFFFSRAPRRPEGTP